MSRTLSTLSSALQAPTLIAQILLIAAPFSAAAQVTAAISGKVTDPTGAGAAAATVTVKNLETGATRTVSTVAAAPRAVCASTIAHNVAGRNSGTSPERSTTVPDLPARCGSA